MTRVRRTIPPMLCSLLAVGTLRAGVVINEVMYNSAGATDVEYVELYNTGPAAQNLTGWYLLDDDDAHDRCLLAGTLNSGAYLVVAGTLNLFTATYPGVTNVNPNAFESPQPGQGFGLGNATDRVRVFNAADALVDSVQYADTDPWPVAPDGNGPSLELLNPALDNSLASAWAASSGNGTPGAQNSVFDADLPPSIDTVIREPALPGAADTVTVTARVTDDQGLGAVELWLSTGGGFAPMLMFDDGMHGDGSAADDVHGALLAPRPAGTLVRYYLRASDTQSQVTTFPSPAPANYLAYTVGYLPPTLAINELLASNQNGVRDEAGDHDDWLEIHNPGPATAALGGMFLSDDLGQTRMWQLPAVTLPAGGYLLVWCDNEAEGPLHANFNLDLAGGEVGLFDSVDHGNVLIHGLTYGLQGPDHSFGYRPEDSDAPEYLTPTPQMSNRTSILLSPVCINEFLAGSAVGVQDWVELYNRGTLSVDISGWYLSDNAAQPLRYSFPPGSVIPPGGFLSVDQDQLGFGFDLDGGEVLALANSNGAWGEDYFDYGQQFNDVSQGRFLDGTSNWHFFSDSSRDLSNSCNQGVPPLGPITHLRFDSASRSSMVWDALAGAESYDVVRGNLLTLIASGGNFTSAVSGCLENNSADTRAWDAETPGGAFFYLVRGVTFSCGFGTFDEGDSGQAAGRDAEIASAAMSCP